MNRKPRNIKIPSHIPQQVNRIRTGQPAFRQVTPHIAAERSSMPRSRNVSTPTNRGCQPWMFIIVFVAVAICLGTIVLGGVGYYLYTQRATTTQTQTDDGTGQ